MRPNSDVSFREMGKEFDRLNSIVDCPRGKVGLVYWIKIASLQLIAVNQVIHVCAHVRSKSSYEAVYRVQSTVHCTKCNSPSSQCTTLMHPNDTQEKHRYVDVINLTFGLLSLYLLGVSFRALKRRVTIVSSSYARLL